jgi:hypothetical protein
MSQNNPLYSISNEQLLLIDILNTMYNDNLNQIQNLTSSNNEIRNLIIRLLNNNNHNNQRGSSRSNRQRTNNYRDLRNNTSTNPLLFEYIFELQPYTSASNEDNTNAFNRLFQRFLEPIEVYPTSTQIEAATRVARYGDILSPLNRSCPISLENFNDDDTVSIIRFCGHTFNRDELNRWFATNCRCPVCRYDIRSYNSNSNSTVNDSTPTPPPRETRTNTSALSQNAEELLNYILDPSGNINSETTNIIQNMLNNYQRRR